jgi:UDP-galactopyranose mutase
MALEFSDHLTPGLTVYDCMDELSAFKFAPKALKRLEKMLFNQADVVFTGGHSLYESKKMQHYNIHPFPSSIDKNHFSKARLEGQEPMDQAGIKGPKIGFYGVIDERFDSSLIQGIADARPDWNIILIGPIVKIDPASLPKNKNVHYLGPKCYGDLPKYLSGWNVALIPFLLNESTRFVSPTKTPEYLCGGKPVVSTAIRDVVTPYGKNKLVAIGIGCEDFVEAIDNYLCATENSGWLTEVDQFLNDNSWDKTCSAMVTAMLNTMSSRNKVTISLNGVSKV